MFSNKKILKFVCYASIVAYASNIAYCINFEKKHNYASYLPYLTLPKGDMIIICYLTLLPQGMLCNLT